MLSKLMMKFDFKAAIFKRRASSAYETIATSGFFDCDWYLKTYRDVAAAHMDPISHYLQWGAAEHRNPGPQFDAKWYVGCCPKLPDVEQNPLLHFLKNGKNAGRAPVSPEGARMLAWRKQVQESGFFDEEWYVRTHRDVASAPIHPLDHFIRFGGLELRSPGPKFDAQSYLEEYNLIGETGLEPLRHYIAFGREQGLIPIPHISDANDAYQRWCTKFDTINDVDRRDIRRHISSLVAEDILVVVHFERTSEKRVCETIGTLTGQLFARWKALIIFDEHCEHDCLKVAETLARADQRLHVVAKGNDDPIPSWFMETGTIVFVSGGVLLREHALYLFWQAIGDPATQVVYSDEDKVDIDGNRHHPEFKPSFSSELLRHKTI